MAIAKGKPISWEEIESLINTFYPDHAAWLADSRTGKPLNPFSTTTFNFDNFTATKLATLCPPNLPVRPSSIVFGGTNYDYDPATEGIAGGGVDLSCFIAPKVFVVFQSVTFYPSFSQARTDVEDQRDSYMAAHTDYQEIVSFITDYNDVTVTQYIATLMLGARKVSA